MNNIINEQISLVLDEIEMIGDSYQRADIRVKLISALTNLATLPIEDEPVGKDAFRNDKKFQKVYAEERQNFLKEFPTSERDHINYFIADEAIKGRPDQGKKETIAETNAILNTYQSVDLLGSRTQYLQQHFPRTIAYLSEKLVPTK